MLQDIRFSLRLLWKQKGFTFAALLTLALCIGANTTVFAILNTVVLRDLPFPESDRLVTIYNIYPGLGISDRGANSAPDYLDRRQLTDVFEAVGLTGIKGYDVLSDSAARRIEGGYVTPSYFRVLKTAPVLGRTFTDDEAVQGKEQVAVLSETLWGEMFARDPNIIGRDIRLSGVPHKIVGVLPDTIRTLNRDLAIWTPFAFTPVQTSDDARHSDAWGMIARLKPGVTIAQARQRIDQLNKDNQDRFPKYRALLEQARFQTKVVSAKDEMIRDVRDTLYLLQAAVLGVLLIGCVNLSSLILARTSARLKEMAVRFSLGAGQWRICRQLLIESGAISVLGALLGIGIAVVGAQGLSSLAGDNLPRGMNIQIDGGALAFTMVTTLVIGMVFGSIPPIYLFKRNLHVIFLGNQRSGTAGRQVLSLRAALVIVQVAVTFVLLTGSGLLSRSFIQVLSVAPGFQAESVTTARFILPPNRYQEDSQRRNFIATMLEKAKSIPGVKHSGVTTYLPFSDNLSAMAIMIAGRELSAGEPPPTPGANIIDSGYLQAMRIPLFAGRNFSDYDGPDSPRVALVDQFMARKYWPNGDTIGAKIQPIGGKDTFTVIGIVGGVKVSDLAEQNPVGQIYFHYLQLAPTDMHVVLRGETDNIPLASPLRRELARMDPELALFDVKTMPERISKSLLNREAAMVVCLAFAGLALLLSAIGIYGVLAYNVAQRTHEIGIRMALGATARNVVSMILGQGVRMAGIGLAIGVVGAFFLTRAMSALLYEVKPHDPLVFLLTTALLAAVAMAASLVPSWRAIRIQPSTALLDE